MLNYHVQTVRSLLIWLFVGLVTLGVFLPVLVSSTLLLPFNPDRRWSHRIGVLWAHLIFWANTGWKVTLTGKKNIPKGACVLISNHESMGDIIGVYLLGVHFKWLAKRSLFRIPFFGWCMSLCGYIPIERGSVKSAARSIETARRLLGKGVPLLIFPEGTRSRDGRLGKFKSGAFRLALEEGVPLVPIVMKGARDVLEKGSWRLNPRIDAVIEVLPAIDAAKEKGLTDSDLSERARSQMSEAIERL